MKDFAKLQFMPFGTINPKGFIREQLLRNKDGMGGHLDLLEPEMFQKPYFEDFHVNGWPDDLAVGWSAELAATCYCGLIELAYTIKDEELMKRGAAWIDKLLATQKEDGYIGTYSKHMDLKLEDFNLYGCGRAFRAMILFAEATGRNEVFDAVHKAMLWFVKNWDGENKTTYSSSSACVPFAYMYKKTGDERLLNFILDYQDFLARQTPFFNSYKDMASKKVEFYSTHTVNYGDLMQVPAFAYSVCGDKKYLDASINGIDKIRKVGVHLNGGPVSIAEYIGPVSSTQETEYCCYTVFNRSYINMGSITGEARYGDYSEEIMYNGAQGARKKDERAIAYMSSPNQVFATDTSSVQMSDYQLYSPCFVVSCCPTNSVNLIPEFVRGMFMRDDKDVYAFTYGPCDFNYNGWKVEEDTLYPFRNTIKFNIEKENDGNFYIRIPIWAKGFIVKVNGEEIKVKKQANGFAQIALAVGKFVVEVEFKAELEIIKIDDSIICNKRPTAFKYGALVFSMPIETTWNEIHPGEMANEERYNDWPCFNLVPTARWGHVFPEIHKNMALNRDLYPWNVAINKNIKAKDVKIEFCETTGYPWENPWVKLHFKGYHIRYGTPPYAARTLEPLGEYLDYDKEIDMELVPHGVTNLRITYFPYANLKKK